MPIGIRRRSMTTDMDSTLRFNWRRGLFRIWLLVSIGWIMGWINYLLIQSLKGQLHGSVTIPIVLFAPPAALLIFGIGARWTIWGFRLGKHSATSLAQTFGSVAV